MPEASFIIINGEYARADEKIFSIDNRAFKYGDALFETMFSSNGVIHFVADHINRLHLGMQAMGMVIPNDFNTTEINKMILRLARRNRFFKGVRIRLSVFRNPGGHYTPEVNSISYTIETTPLENTEYELNTKGISIGVFTDLRKSVSILSAYKTSGAFPSVLAGIYKSRNGFGDALILNDQGNICEAISSNIFLVKNQILYTPAINQGCVNGIMRGVILQLAKEAGYETIESDCISINDLTTAEEVFVTNAIKGIVWVNAWEEYRYFNKTLKLLHSLLNKRVFGN